MNRIESLFIEGYEIKIQTQRDIGGLFCGYLGPRGTYTQQAAQELLQNQSGLIPYSTITEVMKALERNAIDIGFVPIENSIEGNVTESVRSVIHSDLPINSKIQILAEKTLPINHVLFGTSIAMEKRILRSHPQALGQCSLWINNNLPDATIVRENSTAEAIIVATEKDELAIGNRLAGAMYGAKILKEDIMDLKSNHTRFWLLGNGETNPTGDDRVTMVYTLKNRPGTLLKVISSFAKREISINKIDSLPLGTLDEYYFLMSVDGHIIDSQIQEAIEEIKSSVWKIKILGSYQKSRSEIIYDAEAEKNGWINLAKC